MYTFISKSSHMHTLYMFIRWNRLTHIYSWAHILSYMYIYMCTKHLHTIHEYLLHMCSHSPAISLVRGMVPGSPVPQPKAISLHTSFCAHWAGGASVSSLDSHVLNSQTRTCTGKAIATLCLFPYKSPPVHQTL